MQNEFIMLYNKKNQFEIGVISNQADRDHLFRWCEEQFSTIDKGVSHFHEGRMLTRFRFGCLEDLMAFKLTWEDF